MRDDPFADAGLDRTVIMPAPGARYANGHHAPPEPRDGLDGPAVIAGLNPLVAAANPVLNVIPQLRASAEHPNPTALRERLAQGVRQFEASARAAGARSEKIIAARYALCTLVDETAASTPWGVSGAWAKQGLLALFHGETGGGEKFFQLLARLAENPQANLDVLELMYVCLQFGFEGRYRVTEGGTRQLEAIRHRLLSIIRKQRGEYERDLSPNWRGVVATNQPRLGSLPLWVVGAVTALALVAIFLGFRLSLSRASDGLARGIAALGVPDPARPTQPQPPHKPRLAPYLADEIRRGLVAVDDRADRSIVTILGDGLFRPGEATVGAREQWLLSRIGDALFCVPGQVDVVGHTDNAPIRTLRFPSNWELSKARAESVAHPLSNLVPPARLRAHGRGDAEPVAPNETPEGRARNRRVEITLHVPAAASPVPTPEPPRGPRCPSPA
jgi:type VI secretion system protein ImpK